jgi:putative transcriptional regulator
MPYKPISIDRQNLTVMGVSFPDIDTLDSAAAAIGSNMFEGFEPTQKLMELYRDYRLGKIQSKDLVTALRSSI